MPGPQFTKKGWKRYEAVKKSLGGNPNDPKVKARAAAITSKMKGSRPKPKKKKAK